MNCKKIEMIFYNNQNTASRHPSDNNMTVNPDLAILMRVIEDQQDKMPEGEYLAAMNALGSLHRVAPAPPAPPVPGFAAAAPIGPIPSGHPPSYAASAPLFGGAVLPTYHNLVEMMGQHGYNAWSRVTRMIPHHHEMTANQWIALTQEQRNSLIREATLAMVEIYQIEYRNPDPKICPFIARHAVGPWTFGSERSSWTCACGYTGKSKNWKKHEDSERHTDWAKTRFVPKRTIDAMKQGIRKDEKGEILRFNQPLTGGIRYFAVTQERNEWTHPEFYSEIHREKNGHGGWFVHHRDDWAHYHVDD